MKKRLVRHGVFETNSSSCHSLSIGSSQVYESLTPDDEGTILLGYYEFGWEPHTYRGVEARLAYAYIYARDWSRGQDYMTLLKQVVFEHTGATKIVITNEEGPYEGYIDHQSVEDGKLDYLLEDPLLLKSFIFDSYSYVETDNDNDIY
jgi:hypothetical protein